MKMTLNELKHKISEIIEEAKKKPEKADKIKRTSAQVEAYGFYTEDHDFSAPLGAYNRYRQQGAVNWGPMTSDGTHVDQYGPANPNILGLHEADEQALRSVVREVLENGLIDEESAWAPFLARASSEPIFESSWAEASAMLTEKHWFDRDVEKKESEGPKKGKKGHFDKTEYGHVKKHGQEKKEKKK